VLQRLASALLLRKVVGELHAVSEALTEQNRLLGRLVERLAPELPVVDRQVLHAEGASVSFLDPVDAGLALDFVARTHRDTGHVPDEDEILLYLADEKTTDLHKRLLERDAELTRLAEART
jgi:hypothetical protein